MDLLELPDPLFPYILSLVPVNARLGLWSVSTVWNETIVQSLRDVAVVRETYDDVIMEWRGYVVIRAHYLTTEILKGKFFFLHMRLFMVSICSYPSLLYI